MLGILNYLTRGFLMAQHDETASSGPAADTNGNAAKRKAKSLNEMYPPIAPTEPVPPAEVEPDAPNFSAAHVIPPRRKTLAEKKADALAASGAGGRQQRQRPILRQLGADFSRTRSDVTRDVTLISSWDYTRDGVYVVTEEVEDYMLTMGHRKPLSAAEVRLAIDLNGHVFATYTNIDDKRPSGAAYADAVMESENYWVFLEWQDGLCLWGRAPEPAPADPVWPTHRTPDELLDATLETRTISEIHHPLIQRICLARR